MRIPHIYIHIIPHDHQRYDTCGDWQFDEEGSLHVHVSDMESFTSEAAVAIHEIVEALLCRRNGVKEEAVTRFDLQYEQERAVGKHGLTEEPGDDLRAPYREEHQMATFVERCVIAAFGVRWNDHDERVNRLPTLPPQGPLFQSTDRKPEPDPHTPGTAS